MQLKHRLAYIVDIALQNLYIPPSIMQRPFLTTSKQDDFAIVIHAPACCSRSSFGAIA